MDHIESEETKLSETSTGEKKENIESSKSEIESQSIKIEEKKEEEKEIEQMKNFINSFYQAVGDFELQRARAEGNAIKGKNAEIFK